MISVGASSHTSHAHAKSHLKLAPKFGDGEVVTTQAPPPVQDPTLPTTTAMPNPENGFNAMA
ncbi:MAG: hypothetical protein ACKO37_06620 [Vampirovibrionales bacterium]